MYTASRIVREYFHAQGCRVTADDLADIAKADHTQRLPKEFNAVKILLQPLTGFHTRISAGQFPHQSKHHAHRQFRYRDRGCDGRVHNGYLMRFGCVQIDIVNSDTHAADHLEVLCRFNYFRGHFCTPAYDDGIIIGDYLQQFCCFYSLPVIRNVVFGENRFSLLSSPSVINTFHAIVLSY
jgi:hypothetical protein